EAYLAGFETDWRDAYPGINTLEMLFQLGDRGTQLEELRPVVAYAVRRQIASGQPDYWDHATLMELAVLDGDHDEAMARLADVLGSRRASFEGKTTLATLEDLRSAREARAEPAELESTLVEMIAAKVAALEG